MSPLKGIVCICVYIQKTYLVKLCPIFDGSASNCLTKYQKILWRASLGCRNVLNFTWLTVKFGNHHHTSEQYTKGLSISKVGKKWRYFQSLTEMTREGRGHKIGVVGWSHFLVYCHFASFEPQVNPGLYSWLLLLLASEASLICTLWPIWCIKVTNILSSFCSWHPIK